MIKIRIQRSLGKVMEASQPNEAALSHFAAIIAGTSDAVISKTPEGIIQSWNPGAERLFGYAANEMIGSSIRALVPEDRQAEEDDFLKRLSRGDAIHNFATVRQRKNGEQFPVVVTISPIRDSSGFIVGASKIAREFLEARAAEQRVRESEERLHMLADNISQLAWMADANGDIFWYNRRWYDFTGTTLEQVAGWGWRAVHHPDHVDRVVERIQRSWDTGEPWEDTFPLRGHDGAYRWFLSRALPIRDQHGNIVSWFGTNTDVTEQREHQETIQLLMDEVNHRAKNTLSLVQAMARHAAVTEAERAFVGKFSTRLQALAANQDVLVKSGWKGGDAATLIRAQLNHFADLLDSRITLDGPQLLLTTSAVHVLGMSLHELATNAGKYGALSVDTGRVRIAWRHDHHTKHFYIEWTERGGPQVQPPTRTGFGTVIVDKMARGGLQAEVTMDFLPAGITWRLTCPERMAVRDLAEEASVS